ncbi:hypothetical protein V8G54_035063 [Vigna mungo]|uniref:GRF-type domain-containing protein n=1 Tax=Vigna mungo TaxID=3915 RepID=A0AAQ3MFU7_VIGMU
MFMQHSSSSCTCNECRKQFRSRGDGGWSRKDASLSCHFGEKCVLRTVKTTKNREKQLWGCPKYKVGTETVGCNYFKWFTDCVYDESVSCEVLKANDERLLKSFENESDKKIVGRKAVMGLERWTKIVVGVVSVVCVMNIIVIAMLLEMT